VQGINLYDIFARGIIAPIDATSSGTRNSVALPVGNPAGATPFNNLTGNPNFAASAATLCATLPGPIPSNLLTDLRTIFTTGAAGSTIGAGCGVLRLGGVHANAIGYITVDVGSTCSTSLPGPAYFSTEVLYDNVLIGDYQDINPNPTTGNFAGGNPMVHIRAIPEGGPAGSIPGTNLPYTFYDRYTTSVGIPRTVDRRVPLPSTFAARWIQGGTGAFNTNYKIWREGITGPSSTLCAVAVNSSLAIADEVRFDEHENATSLAPSVPISPAVAGTPTLPETSSTSTTDTRFPPLAASPDLGGWMYLNLNNGGSANYSSARPGFSGAATSVTVGPRQSQNWVIISMFAEGRYSVDFDAAHLGNGCSISPPNGARIEPSGGTPVCPAAIPALAGCTPGVAPYPGTNVTP
jgi:hypothetical protein